MECTVENKVQKDQGTPAIEIFVRVGTTGNPWMGSGWHQIGWEGDNVWFFVSIDYAHSYKDNIS